MTLLRCINRLENPTSGEILIDGMSTLEATKTILISPYSFSESRKIQENDIRIRDWETVGYKGEISVFAVPIPANETQWDDFVAKMQNVEKELVEKIKAQIEK